MELNARWVNLPFDEIKKCRNKAMTDGRKHMASRFISVPILLVALAACRNNGSSNPQQTVTESSQTANCTTDKRVVPLRSQHDCQGYNA